MTFDDDDNDEGGQKLVVGKLNLVIADWFTTYVRISLVAKRGVGGE